MSKSELTRASGRGARLEQEHELEQMI